MALDVRDCKLVVAHLLDFAKAFRVVVTEVASVQEVVFHGAGMVGKRLTVVRSDEPWGSILRRHGSLNCL